MSKATLRPSVLVLLEVWGLGFRVSDLGAARGLGSGSFTVWDPGAARGLGSEV